MYEISRRRKFMETESVSEVIRGWGEGKEMENYCSNGMLRKFWKQGLAMLTQHRNVIPLNCMI